MYIRKGEAYTGNYTHDNGRALVKPVSVHSIQKASRLQRVVDAAMPRICEVESPVQEAGLQIRHNQH